MDENEKVLISSITLDELENIKTSVHKDANTKYSARQILRDINTNPDKYEIILYKEKMIKPIEKIDLSITNDTKILASALDYNKHHKDRPIDNFITNDLTLKCIAQLFLSNVSSLSEEEIDDYSGYKEVILSDDETAEFYQDLSINRFSLMPNEYLLVYNEGGQLIDKLVWTGETHRNITFGNFTSSYLGNIKPFKDDPYQALLCDSLIHNKITLVKGKAGSGKTIISLGYLLSQLERNRIDKIIVFCNTVATRNSARLGLIIG